MKLLGSVVVFTVDLLESVVLVMEMLESVVATIAVALPGRWRCSLRIC